MRVSVLRASTDTTCGQRQVMWRPWLRSQRDARRGSDNMRKTSFSK